MLPDRIESRTAAILVRTITSSPRAGPEAPRSPGLLPWATLLRRVFAIEVLVCPRCAGPRRIVGAVTEPHAVRRLLRDIQGLLPESDGLVVVASQQALDHHEGGDPREPALVAERPGEPLGFVADGRLDFPLPIGAKTESGDPGVLEPPDLNGEP
jgi:hypothetical protein